MSGEPKSGGDLVVPVRIIYKSGATMDVSVQKMAVDRDALGGLLLTWLDMWPKPLHLGVEDIAAIFQTGEAFPASQRKG